MEALDIVDDIGSGLNGGVPGELSQVCGDN
jgi:hypothetical protein